MQHADLAIVGAGILGLAHALEAAKRGYRVVVFERNQRALGASIRNFGMILPICMAAGRIHDLAMQSRQTWLAVAPEAGFWIDPAGSLILAHHDDELAVLAEFAAEAPRLDCECQLLTPDEVVDRSQAVRSEGLRGGLWSPAEMIVDPRQAVAKLPIYLQSKYTAAFYFGKAVTFIDIPYLEAGGETWKVERAVVCSGSDFETLYPQHFFESGLTKCKLQVMRTAPQPNGWRLGPMLATGLSLRHYAAFAGCPSLPQLQKRLIGEYPEYERWGIHILVSQNALGELTLGDSHEYGLDLDPFDKAEIDELILSGVRQLLYTPSLQIAQRWHGIYAKHPGNEPVVLAPHPMVRIVVGWGGAGMTTAFGLAREVVAEWDRVAPHNRSHPHR